MLKRTDFSEKRQFGRRAANLHAWIRVGGRPPQPCTLSNISDGGALITLIGEAWIPYSFRLTSDDKTVDWVCEIRHQSGPRVGVEFVAPGHEFDRIRAARDAGAASDSWAARSVR
jgi:hypothetical protein